MDLHCGLACTELIESDGAVAGIRATAHTGPDRTLTARLVVGADGRASTVARLARVRVRQTRNERAFMFAYFGDLEYPAGQRSRLWLMDPDGCAAFPNEHGISVAAAAVGRRKLGAVGRRNAAEVLEAQFASAPRAPVLDRRKRLSPVPWKRGRTSRTACAATSGRSGTGWGATTSMLGASRPAGA